MEVMLFKAFLRHVVVFGSQEISTQIRRASWDAKAIPLWQALPDKIIEFEYAGEVVKFYVPNGHTDGIQKLIMIDQTFWEAEELDWLRRNVPLRGAHVVDAGANIGNHTVYFSKICLAASCVAFEPSRQLFSILERNAQINALSGVTLHNEALSDKMTKLSVIRRAASNLGMTAYTEGEFDAAPVQARTLDSYHLGALDFLKIDVEYMTTKLLSGAEETIAQFHPIILTEISREEEASARGLLSKHGYRQTRDMGAETYLFEH